MHNDEETNYWSSFSDMSFALLLLFALIMALYIFKFTIEVKQKDGTIKYQAGEITHQKEEIDEAEEQYRKTAKEIEDTAGMLKAVVGVRLEIYQNLLKEFGTNGEISFDENGDIEFSSEILFDTDKSQLKDQGKEFLEDFFPRYLSVLMKSKYRDNISEILIIGHTDDDCGNIKDPIEGYLYNLELSQERANSVVNYCIRKSGLSGSSLEFLEKVLSANGKSFSQLKRNSFGIVDKAKSRRVEVKFRLKDEEGVENITSMADKMMDIVNKH